MGDYLLLFKKDGRLEFGERLHMTSAVSMERQITLNAYSRLTEEITPLLPAENREKILELMESFRKIYL